MNKFRIGCFWNNIYIDGLYSEIPRPKSGLYLLDKDSGSPMRLATAEEIDIFFEELPERLETIGVFNERESEYHTQETYTKVYDSIRALNNKRQETEQSVQIALSILLNYSKYSYTKLDNKSLLNLKRYLHKVLKKINNNPTE